MQTSQTSPKPRALIVEDETLIAEELTARLACLGFSVIAAVESAEEGSPSLPENAPIWF